MNHSRKRNGDEEHLRNGITPRNIPRMLNYQGKLMNPNHYNLYTRIPQSSAMMPPLMTMTDQSAVYRAALGYQPPVTTQGRNVHSSPLPATGSSPIDHYEQPQYIGASSYRVNPTCQQQPFGPPQFEPEASLQSQSIPSRMATTTALGLLSPHHHTSTLNDDYRNQNIIMQRHPRILLSQNDSPIRRNLNVYTHSTGKMIPLGDVVPSMTLSGTIIGDPSAEQFSRSFAVRPPSQHEAPCIQSVPSHVPNCRGPQRRKLSVRRRPPPFPPPAVEEGKKRAGVQLHSDKTWNVMFDRLVQFQQSNGHCLVPRHHRNDYKLGNWVNFQRYNKTKGCLSLERTKMLDNIGFAWSATETWNAMFKRLILWKENHGDCLVRQECKEDPRLGLWVMTQRRKKSMLPPERVAQLNSVGFIWSVHQAVWDTMFASLVEYKLKNGHYRMAWSYTKEGGPPLGKWVYEQHRNKKKLPPERVAQLESVGFYLEE